ncbi:dipeptidyl peptidase 3-like isoform X1 [Leptopilina boulardi]|uniref:dipeptidyl peptidase 3-like isoform X1 n=2 Tax=Leptopilina boulardi TaxID=63433 RepID=UPI0021F65C79|nr:dipeptidyl peptidase 3-like isoform X1 [Leptopilina boulardi]
MLKLFSKSDLIIRSVKFQTIIVKPSFSIIKRNFQNLENNLSRIRNHRTMSSNTSLYTLPNNQPVVYLECTKAFDALTDREKLYAHYLSQAAWNGSLITFIQTSPESPLLFALLHQVFLAESIESLKTSSLAAGVSEDEFTAFLVFANGFFSNAGNYKSFGDSKIIPNMSEKKFVDVIKSSVAYKQETKNFQSILDAIKGIVFSVEGKLKTLGLGDKGITTYFSSNCTMEDADLINEFMLHKGLESYNTRCFKTTENGVASYEIRLASIEESNDNSITSSEETFKNSQFKITRGDYSQLLAIVVKNLEKAKAYAANNTEKSMLDRYIAHFSSGSLEEHKNGSRFWVKDKSPVIETYIGFIETYRDPAGQRGEFEGFVAMVNKEMSKKFADLVDKAEQYLPRLPWGRDFEKDAFLRPDFTSLDVLTFGGSGIPAGINIPNYDEIKQSEGFKNVSLGNVIPANMKQDVMMFLTDEDQTLMHKHRVPSFEVQVGLHELLGHGSGKLLKKDNDDTFNFDPSTVVNPLTGKPIDKFYMKGETYDSKFGTISSSYEECRAEAVGLYLSLDKDVLGIFGHSGPEADDIIYVNWMSLIWAGCAKALEMYEPSTKTWLQAHSQARYVLMRVCIEAGENFVTVEETEPGKNLSLKVDRSKLNTVGRKAVGEFLKKLQIYKSTGDIEEAKRMYDKYSEVPEAGPQPWAKWRDIVLANKQPRKIFVQSNTCVDKNDETKIDLKTYDATFDGFIKSWTDRFPDPQVSRILVDLWNKDAHFFNMETLKN